MKCNHCGNENSEKAKFCGRCGSSLLNSAQAPEKIPPTEKTIPTPSLADHKKIFTLPNGKQFWLQRIRGVVAGSNRWTETHVSGSGSKGEVSIGSKTVQHLEFWITQENGAQKHIKLETNHVSVMDGQNVIAFYGAPCIDQESNGVLMHIMNLNTNTNWDIDHLNTISLLDGNQTGILKNLAKGLFLAIGSMATLIAVPMYFFIATKFHASDLVIIPIVGGTIYLWKTAFSQFKENLKINDYIKQCIHSMG